MGVRIVAIPQEIQHLMPPLVGIFLRLDVILTQGAYRRILIGIVGIER